MSGEEFILAVLSIVGGISLAGYIFAKIFGLIKVWLEGRSGNGNLEEHFNRLGKAFVQHKKEMERRVQNLEAIVIDEDEEHDIKELNEPTRAIEIEDEAESEPTSESSLSNDLEDKKSRERSR